MEEYPDAPYFIPLIWQGDGQHPSPQYSQRGAIYGVGGIPHSQWGGVYDIVGGGGSTMFTQYRTRYNAMVNWVSPLEIELILDPSYQTLTAEITVTEEITTSNNKLIYIISNHQNDDYFSSVVTYEELDFDLTTVGENQTFEYEIDTAGYNIENLTINVLVQSMASDYRILQASRVIVAEEKVPLHAEEINFDPTMVGEESTQTLDLYNYYSEPITFMFFPPPGFSAPADYTLEANSIGSVDITFAPQNEGTYTDMLIVTTSLEEYPNFFIDVSGEALPGNSQQDNEINGILEITGNYPNPFNPETTISYEIKESANITLEIFNIKGESMAVLFDGYKDAGKHQINWDAGNLSSGFYIAKLKSGSSSTQTKMLLLK